MFKSNNSIAIKKLISVAVIAFAIPLTVFFVVKGIQLLSHAALSPVTLSFSQNPITLNNTTPTSVNVLLNASNNKIGFSAVQFTFDPSKVKLTSEITTSTSLKTVISKTTMVNANSTGTVTLVLGLDPADSANAPTGSFQLATLSLQAVASNQASSTIAFVPANIQIVDTLVNALTVNVTNSTVSGSATPTPTPTHTPTPTPNPSHTPTATPVPTATPTHTPTPTATANPTSGPSGQVNFTIKLQGITTQGSNRVVSFVIKNGNTVVSTNSNVSVTSNSSGVYSGSVSNVTPGTYDIYVKESTHLSRKFSGITIASGSNNINLTAKQILAGDFNNDNTLNISDVGQILSHYLALSTAVDQTNAIYDVDNNGTINVIDVSIVLSNYTQLEVLGE